MSELCPNLMESAKRGVINASTISKKALFYPSKTEQQISEQTPILLLNEADALLSVRLTQMRDAVDQMAFTRT